MASFFQWVDAYVRGEGELAEFYFRRFRAEFKPAVNAWIATRPLKKPQRAADAVCHAPVQARCYGGGEAVQRPGEAVRGIRATPPSSVPRTTCSASCCSPAMLLYSGNYEREAARHHGASRSPLLAFGLVPLPRRGRLDRSFPVSLSSARVSSSWYAASRRRSSSRFGNMKNTSTAPPMHGDEARRVRPLVALEERGLRAGDDRVRVLRDAARPRPPRPAQRLRQLRLRAVRDVLVRGRDGGACRRRITRPSAARRRPTA